MKIFLNGQIVDEQQAVVSVFDRGFLYGDGLFETVRVKNGKCFRWQAHWDRLREGLELLGIQLPYTGAMLQAAMGSLIKENNMPDAVLRVVVTRGVGPRGYSPKGANSPTLVLSLHPAAATEALSQWRLVTAPFHLPAEEILNVCKSCSKLTHVMARADAEARGADEAVLLNTNQLVAEATSGNIFWLKDGVLRTPPSTAGLLPGITRRVVLELCQRKNLPTLEQHTSLFQLSMADAVFVTLSTLGVVEVIELDGNTLRTAKLTQDLHAELEKLIAQECA